MLCKDTSFTLNGSHCDDYWSRVGEEVKTWSCPLVLLFMYFALHQIKSNTGNKLNVNECKVEISVDSYVTQSQFWNQDGPINRSSTSANNNSYT